MDVAKKVEIANLAVDSISRHDDEDAAVRKHMLTLVLRHIEAEVEAIDARLAARVVELTQLPQA